MADANKELAIIISARDQASRTIEGIGAKFGDLVNASKAGSIALAGTMGFLGKSIIDTASDMEQAKVAFTTMTGSADIATKTLSDLSDFAKKTPFTFPSIVEASKRLLAYNVEAKNLIPTLSTLGNISSGVGMEKMPQLILAFGQVKAATRLTGMELRQFSEAGVPLLQALVDQANKAGGKWVTVGGQAKKAAGDVKEMNDKLAIASQALKEAEASGKSKESTLMRLRNTVENYTEKIGKASGGTEEARKVWVKTKTTAAEMKEMIEDGAVSFEMVQKALESIGGEQGKWGDLMEKQSKTFSGRLSNIQDQLVRVALNIAGISTETESFGEIIKGGAFDLLSQGVQQVLNFLNDLEPKIKGLIDGFVKNQTAIAVTLGILTGGLLGAAVALAQFLAPLFILMAIGGAVGLLLSQLVEWMGGLNNVIAIATQAWNFMATGWTMIVQPALLQLVNIFRNELLPELQRLWNELSPILIPTLHALAAVLGTTLLLAIRLIIEALILLTRGFISFSENVRKAIDLVKYIISGFKGSVKTDFNDVLSFVNVLSGGWVKRFTDMIQAVKWLVDSIDGLIRKAKELAGNVAGGLKIPGFQHGGFVPGSYGEAVPAILHGGERVIPRTGVDVNNGGGGANVTINISGSFNLDSDQRVNELADKIIDILGRQNELAAKGLAI